MKYNKKHLIGILTLLIGIISIIISLYIVDMNPTGFLNVLLFGLLTSLLVFIIAPISLLVSFICFNIIKPDN